MTKSEQRKRNYSPPKSYNVSINGRLIPGYYDKNNLSIINNAVGDIVSTDLFENYSVEYPMSIDRKIGKAKRSIISNDYGIIEKDMPYSSYGIQTEKPVSKPLPTLNFSGSIQNKLDDLSVVPDKKISDHKIQYKVASKSNPFSFVQDKFNTDQVVNDTKKHIDTITNGYSGQAPQKISPLKATQASGKQAAKNTAKKAMKESDKLFSKLGKYSKVALGFGATAWLVNKLSDTRGQQTNAQLYGQQQYY